MADGVTGGWFGSELSKPSGRLASNSASVIRDPLRSSIGESKSMDSTRLNRVSTEGNSSWAILVMSVLTRVKEEFGPRTKRTVTLPDGSLLQKTLTCFLLLSAKPARRDGRGKALEHSDEHLENLPTSLKSLGNELEHSDEHLENLPKSWKCFGIPRPSPRGVACLDVVFPSKVCLTKDKSLWKPNIWITTFMLFCRFSDVITPWKDTR